MNQGIEQGVTPPSPGLQNEEPEFSTEEDIGSQDDLADPDLTVAQDPAPPAR